MNNHELNEVDLKKYLTPSFPQFKTYDVVSSVTQANAQGYLVRVDDTDSSGKGLVTVFVKVIDAHKYRAKPWSDLRRTLLYARTEVRFYNEILPALSRKGLKNNGIIAPRCFQATCDLDGLIQDNKRAADVPNDDEPKEGDLVGKGGFLLLEAVDSSIYFQDSPLTPGQACHCLVAIAKLHAAAWEDHIILEKAASRLSRGSYHLQVRSPKELHEMENAWSSFMANFKDYAPDIFKRPSVQQLGTRLARVAHCISAELSPDPTDPYATLVHGDYKAMNVFLPKDEESKQNAVMIDFASCGVGLGLSDVAMHVYHALRPNDINEEYLLDIYLAALNDVRQSFGSTSTKPYPRNVALRHFRLASIDYARFFLGRFWKTATLESMEKKKNSKNTCLLNRDADAAVSFVAKVDEYLSEYEKELS